MAPWLRLAALPSSLLALITTSVSPVSSQTLRWPYNLPPDAKYYPEDEILIKRDIDIQQMLQSRPPTGVRKMSGDPGEKFYLEYWDFGEGEQESNCSGWTNTFPFFSFEQPVRIHAHDESSRLFKRFPGSHLFEKRGFQCPSGTLACSSIDRPNSCCATGSTCQIVQDAGDGLGDVGCCPNGETCADTLSPCASGYTSCPNNPGGGCCLPGYACFDVGCIQTSTATISPAPKPSTTTVTSYTTVTPDVTTTSPTSTSTTTTTTSTTSTSSTTTTSPLPPVILTITRTVTVTASTSNSLTCSSGFRSCPASVGGGCCPTDRECGSANCPASTTSTTTSATAVPPVRPTSLTTTVETTTVSPPSTTTTSSTSSTTTPVSGCPTGFYACSAYYQGGCCQVGRDCASTSCPATASTTLVSGSTLTIIAPTGDGITAPGTMLTGSCAGGWATCAASIGGGCCPSGYDCGVSSCSAGVSGGGDVGKMAPSAAAKTTQLNLDSWTLVGLCLLACLMAELGALGL